MTSQEPHQMLLLPTWGLGLLSLLLIGGLLLVSGLIVSTVLVSSRQSLAIWPRIKAGLAVLAWVVPSLAIVGYIAVRSESHFANQPPAPHVAVMQVSPATLTENPPIVAEAPIAVDLVVEPVAVNPVAPPTDEPGSDKPRLKVRSISSDDPHWTEEARFVTGRELVCLSSQRFATLSQAESQITDEALQAVKQHYQGQFPLNGAWDVPVAAVERYGVKNMVGEVIDKDFGNGLSAKMYRTHLQLDYTPQLADAIFVSMRGQIVHHRLLILGSLLGLVTLMLGSAAGYFRLDELTGGAFRRRLKLAATAVIAAGSIVAVRMVS